MNKDIYKKNLTKQEYEDYLIECLSKCIIKFNKKEDIAKMFSFPGLESKNNIENNKDLFEIKQNENGDDIFFINNIVVDQESFLQKLAKQTKK